MIKEMKYMKLALFTDTFYQQVNGVARTLKRLTHYLGKIMFRKK
jgi:hypothetical protein